MNQNELYWPSMSKEFVATLEQTNSAGLNET